MAQLNIPTVPIPAGALVCDPQAELVLSSQVMTPFPDTSLQPQTKETQAKEETFVLQSRGIMVPHRSHFGRRKKSLSTACCWEGDPEIPLVAQVTQGSLPHVMDTGVPAPESSP